VTVVDLVANVANGRHGLWPSLYRPLTSDDDVMMNMMVMCSYRKQGNKLRRLMTFAWPCLLPKMCVDPATKYHGHLLLSHIIAKFAIHKRIVLQVSLH